MLKNKIKSTVAAISGLMALATPAFAEDINPTGWENICDIANAVLPVIYGIAGVIALILLVMGGIQYMSSGGDKIAVEQARGRITSAIVGLVIVFGAYLVINVIGTQVLGDVLDLCK